MNGYTGKIVRVNLTNREVSYEQPPVQWYKQYIGGKGMGYRYLLQDVAPSVDPLGPENELIFMTGPFAGTVIPTSSRLAVMTKSPLTGTILVSLVGGSVAAELKYAGYDGIIVNGKASDPVYIKVVDEAVTIEDASHLWTKGIFETEQIIQENDAAHNVKTLSIGPAGENQVLYACIGVDSYHQAGRGGAGAVMGSKNLKAIAIKGSAGIKVDRMDEFLNMIKELRDKDVLTDAHLWTDTDGTPVVVDASNETGLLPVKNWQETCYDQVEGINSEALKPKTKKSKACFSCPLGCGRFSEADDGSLVEGPEYETIALAGSNCGLASIDGLIRYNRLCDDLGIDTMSAGSVLAFAMEATEKGLYDFGIRFGQEDKMLEYIKKIAYREGDGDKLALGVKKLSSIIGAQKIAVEVKGLEFPAYDPRASYGMALAYATSERGACHERAFAVEEDALGHMDPFTFEGKAEVVKRQQDYNSAKECLVICDFWRPSAETLTQLLARVTGLELSVEEFLNCGERIWNMGRLFNLREGFSRADDYLPYRVLHDKLQTGPSAGREFDSEAFQRTLSELYELRGWDEQGNVKPETCERLQISLDYHSAQGGAR